MDNIDYKEVTNETYNSLNNANPFSYETLFNLLNYNDDIEVCKKARTQLYKMIAIDFLKNYLRSDFYDKMINGSFEIFDFLKDYLEDDNEYMDRMKDHLTSKSPEESIQRA